jgi:type II secretion system protein G
VVCYHPVARSEQLGLHSITASQVATTNRPDPAIVFLPEEHEAIIRRRARRKVAAITGAVVILLSSAAWLVYQHGEPARQKQRLAARREQMAVNELRMLADGLERFKVDVGRYPTTEEGIVSLRVKPYNSAPDTRSQLINWYGPYLDGDYELDPWGNDYLYRATNDAQGFELSSNGPNGTGENAAKLRITSGEE